MSDLVEIIERVKSNKDRDGWNEFETRVFVIHKVLSTLGYSDSEIRHEYPVRTGMVDLAMLANTDHMWFIEAKRWSQSLLDREIDQTLNYANVYGRRFAVLTNGQEWRLYDNSIQGQSESKKLLQFSLFDSDAEDKFQFLNRANMIDEAVLKYIEVQNLYKLLDSELINPQSSLLKVIRKEITKRPMSCTSEQLSVYFTKLIRVALPVVPQFSETNCLRTPEIESPTKPRMPNLNQEIESNLNELVEQNLKFSKPAALTIYGDRVEVTKWIEVLSKVLEFLYKRDKLPSTPYKISWHSAGPWLVASQDSGVPMRSPKEVPGSEGKYLFEANLSASSIARFVRVLCDQAGFPPDSLRIKWKPRND